MAAGMSRPAVAMLAAGIALSAGCGAASGQGTSAPAQSTRSAQPAQAPARGPSGVAGQAVELVCGGPASEQGCPRRSVIATIDVLRMPSGRHVAALHTDQRGRFRLDLPAGTYQLQASAPSHLVWARVVTTRVLPHQTGHLTIAFTPRHPLPVTPGTASG